MGAMYVVHIVAGSLGLLSGYTALYVTKGAPLHRRSGMVFVWTMLTMATAGFLMTALRGVAVAINIPAAVLTAYLVITALLTVRPRPATQRWLDPALMLVALAVGLIMVAFGLEAIANGGTRRGMPAFPFFMFAFVGLLGAVLDIRMMRAGGVRGAVRITRHLWRMCFALFIAAMSFFLGQADEFPAALRKPALLALPVLFVLATLMYWLWRVRIRRAVGGIVDSSAAKVLLPERVAS